MAGGQQTPINCLSYIGRLAARYLSCRDDYVDIVRKYKAEGT